MLEERIVRFPPICKNEPLLSICTYYSYLSRVDLTMITTSSEMISLSRSLNYNVSVFLLNLPLFQKQHLQPTKERNASVFTAISNKPFLSTSSSVPSSLLVYTTISHPFTSPSPVMKRKCSFLTSTNSTCSC